MQHSAKFNGARMNAQKRELSNSFSALPRVFSRLARFARAKPPAARYTITTLLLLFVLAGCTALDSTTPGPTPSPGPTATLAPTATPLPDPQPVARAYLDAWAAEDYTTMYAWLTPLSQDAILQDDFIAIYRNLAATMSLQIVEYEILSTLTETRSAQVGYRVTFHTTLVGDIQRDTVMGLSYEGAQWRVQWDHTLIMPELSGGNTLWMDYRVPARGNIYDRQGRALVAQTDAVSLGLIVGETDPEQEYSLFQELWALTGLHPDEIRRRRDAAREGWYLPLGEAAAEQVEARYAVLTQMDGLVMEPYRSRYYFEGGIAPQVLGYVSIIQPDEVEYYQRLGYQQDERVGKMGLEQWGEPYLAGEHAGALYVVSPEGEIVTKLAESESQAAQAIYTTLDKDLQLAAQQALTGFLGAIIVVERDTGRILAMASSPNFDPNLFEPTNYNSEYLLGDLLTDPQQPLLNRAAQGQYPLGSVFKIITMSAGLESEMFVAGSAYYCGHTFSRGGSVRYDWTYSFGVRPSGLLTLPEGLMRSCNPWFWHIGLTLYDNGMETAVSDMAKAFGLGALTGIELIAEEAGNIPVPQSRNDAINNAIGQGDTLVTPLQVVRFIAAVGNGGSLLRLQLVERIEYPDGRVTISFKPEIEASLPISAEDLTLVQDAMRSVVENRRGTAWHRFINYPIPVAGKTGTAEAPPGEPHAWFTGYTLAGDEAERPDIAAVVVLEHAGEGSVVAAPIFKRMLEVYYSGRPVSPFPWENDLDLPPIEDVDTP